VQAQCPQCSTRIQIEDAKVPDRPFKVRCPKCQHVMTLPGRGQAPAEETEPAPPPAPPAPPPPAPPPEAPAPMLSQAALERAERAAAGERDAIVALVGPAAEPLQKALEHLGFHVDVVEDIEEGARLLEQGVYEVAVTSRSTAEPGRPETLAQRMLRMPLDTRRRAFVVLVGEEFRSGDGTQAWAAQADLVLHPNDTARAEHLVRATMTERKRLYQPLVDARRRIESE
jgi:predicted Zn finger-like uncharacterized protein